MTDETKMLETAPELLTSEAASARRRRGRSMGRRPGRPTNVEIEARRAAAAGEAPVPVVPAREQNLPIWSRRARALKRAGTTPRDFYENDPMFYRFVNPDAKKHVRILWMSDLMWRKRPMLEGFMWDIYEPITDALAKELGVEFPNTRQRGPDGVIRCGADAFATWAPEEIAKQQNEYWAQGARAQEMMRRRAEELDVNLAGHGIGDVVVSNDPQVILEAETAQRNELGRQYKTNLQQ